MGKRKVVVSCGPIPARLDSVKFLTNRFKGGLAFETARRLADDGDLEVTVVKWKHTPLPWEGETLAMTGIHTVINVIDVVEYAKWFEEHAVEYDAFVMAAAVANLMPSNPYETKFPSHLYKVGEKFDIQFEIAPRAIDIVKRVNPRCCLVGYKLFDADTDEELVDIARHTLEDAKANVIFANRPLDAKSKKIAVMADGAAIPMDFDEHVEFIGKAIRAEYFRTEDAGTMWYSEEPGPKLSVKAAMALVKYFEKTFPHFGTVAFRVPDGMVTTSRGHKEGPVLVTDVDFDKKVVYVANGMKATLNAPLLWDMIERNKCDYIVHRHFDDPLAKVDKGFPFAELDYEFPGTVGEVEAYEKAVGELGKVDLGGIVIHHHGFLIPMNEKSVNWSKYYEVFPERYFGTREELEEAYAYAEAHPELDTLEVGGNSTCRLKYNLDPNMEGETIVTYDDLSTMRFDLVVARNSINYLSERELFKVLNALGEGGRFIANGFAEAPLESIRCEEGRREVAVKRFDSGLSADVIDHFLIVDDQIYAHTFYARGEEEYRALGFDVERKGSSIVIRKTRGKKEYY